jgi:hypothetical protein
MSQLCGILLGGNPVHVFRRRSEAKHITSMRPHFSVGCSPPRLLRITSLCGKNTSWHMNIFSRGTRPRVPWGLVMCLLASPVSVRLPICSIQQYSFFLVGKTTYIAYVLFRRLQNKLPTAVQLDAHTFVLFDSQGPQFHSTEIRKKMLLSRDTWALSDSSASLIQPCDAFQKSTALLIHTTSPARHRWKTWAKQLNARVYVMDVWKLDEMHAVLYVLPPPYH